MVHGQKKHQITWTYCIFSRLLRDNLFNTLEIWSWFCW